MSARDNALLRDVIFPNHPDFGRSRVVREMAKKDPRTFNVPYLVELTMAAIGGYEFVDAAHYDFTDGTDSKITSVSSNPIKSSPNSYAGTVTNVCSQYGKFKTGGLRIIAYVTPRDECWFYYLPLTVWKPMAVVPKIGNGYIGYQYNTIKDDIVRFSDYRLGTFRELAMAKG